MATPLDDLKASYAQLCSKLAEITANPQPSYSEKGRSISWDQHRDSIVKQINDLAKIPGVAPDQKPVFTVTSVAR
jgi:hypothetical protein